MTWSSQEADAVRRQVLGDAYVDRSRGGDDLSTVLTEHVTEHCWGAVWTRPGLALRDRSIVTVSVLAATGRWTELATHLRGARRNGLSAEELMELVLHVSVYAGVPVALEATRILRDVLHEDGT